MPRKSCSTSSLRGSHGKMCMKGRYLVICNLFHAWGVFLALFFVLFLFVLNQARLTERHNFCCCYSNRLGEIVTQIQTFHTLEPHTVGHRATPLEQIGKGT